MKANRSMSAMTGMKIPDYASIVNGQTDYDHKLKDALYFVHYEISTKQLKVDTIKFAKKQRLDVDLAHISSLDNYYFASVGKLCYIINRGAEVTPDWYSKIVKQIHNLSQANIEIDDESEDVPRQEPDKAIIKAQKEKMLVDDVCSAIERWVDEFLQNPKSFNIETRDVESLITDKKITEDGLNNIATNFDYDYQMLLDVERGDEYAREAYNHISRSGLSKIKQFYEKVFDVCEKAKKPIKKQLPPEKRVMKLKYLPQITEIGVVSLHPKNIIGMKELWVYNTKTRKYGKLVSKNGLTLDVEDQQIINIDEDSSTEKMVIKNKKFIKDINIKNAQKIYDSFSSLEIKLNPKLTPNHVLLCGK